MTWENDEMKQAYERWNSKHPLMVEGKLAGYERAKVALCALIDVLEKNNGTEWAEWDLLGVVRYSIAEKSMQDRKAQERDEKRGETVHYMR